LAHVRFTPEEYHALRALCRDIHLRDECFPIFRYFLAEALHERWPDLAARVALFRERQLRLLFRHLQARQAASGRAAREKTLALSDAEVEAVIQAARLFGLCGGARPHFRAFLTRYFRAGNPGLADKLARLSERALAELYRQSRRPARWRAH
jgi:hypothetical protein